MQRFGFIHMNVCPDITASRNDMAGKWIFTGIILTPFFLNFQMLYNFNNLNQEGMNSDFEYLDFMISDIIYWNSLNMTWFKEALLLS